MRKDHCDVIIVGAGIAGTTMALILARQGLRVTIVDQTNHPRFALGESLLRPTTLWMRVLAARYDVPELDVLAHADKISQVIAPTSGVKKCFGFLYHEPDASYVERCWWLSLPTSFEEETLEAHLFRQDVDAYLYHAAIGEGCCPRMGSRVEDTQITDAGVRVVLADGSDVNGQYLVDASGFAAVVARQFGLQEKTPPFKTTSRALFTHMLGVRPFDEVSGAAQPARRWNDGTLHHIIDGGWIWVIPFDNYRGSRNPLCSVGLSLDSSRYPRDPNISPSQEWANVLSRYPVIAQQFRDAVPVRSWVATDRLQYAAKACAGERYCLLSQATGSVDAIYSRGLLNTFQGINVAADLIIKAFADRDFSPEKFDGLTAQQMNLLAVNDGLAYGTYQSFRDPDLFERWLGLYSLCEQLSIRHVLAPLHRYLQTGDTNSLDFDDEMPGHCIPEYPQFRALLKRCLHSMEDLRCGDSTVEETKRKMDDALNTVPSLGYDHKTLVNVATRLNFTRTARRYFEAEGVLIEMLDALDEDLGLSWHLRSSAFCGYVVRALAKELTRAVTLGADLLGAPLTDLCEPLRPASVTGLSLNNSDLITAINGVRPEIAPDAEQQTRLANMADSVERMQIYRVASSIADLNWAAMGREWRIDLVRPKASDQRSLGVWSMVAGEVQTEILIAYQVAENQTYLVHIAGLFARKVVECQSF